MMGAPTLPVVYNFNLQMNRAQCECQCLNSYSALRSLTVSLDSSCMVQWPTDVAVIHINLMILQNLHVL